MSFAKSRNGNLSRLYGTFTHVAVVGFSSIIQGWRKVILFGGAQRKLRTDHVATRPYTYSEGEVRKQFKHSAKVWQHREYRQWVLAYIYSTQITIDQFIQGPLLAFQFTVPSRVFAKAQWTTVLKITIYNHLAACYLACTINRT